MFKRNCRKVTAILSLSLFLCSCGRLGAPLPPEVFAPQAVQKLAASADSKGVILSWEAPELDRRNQELKSIEGYRVTRQEFQRDKAEGLLELTPAGEEEEPEILEFVEDSHLEVLEKLRKDARAAGKSARKVDVDPTTKQFRYVDTSVTPGVYYRYSIVPVNQSGTKGVVRQDVELQFRGDLNQPLIVDRFAASREPLEGQEDFSLDSEAIEGNPQE